MNVETDHRKITAAGWAYRTNDRGWVIYREPQTGRWYTRADAIRQITLSAARQPGFRATLAN